MNGGILCCPSLRVSRSQCCVLTFSMISFFLHFGKSYKIFTRDLNIHLNRLGIFRGLMSSKSATKYFIKISAEMFYFEQILCESFCKAIKMISRIFKGLMSSKAATKYFIKICAKIVYFGRFYMKVSARQSRRFLCQTFCRNVRKLAKFQLFHTFPP